MAIAKSERILSELREELAAGKLGQCGDVFMTTRELCEYKNISLKTAFHVLTQLKEENYLEKSGRCHRIVSLLPPTGRQGTPMLIGFLATSLSSPYFAALASHAEDIVHSVGASMIIASSNYNFQTECERLQMFCRQRVAGILICPWASTEEDELFYEQLGVPFVVIGRKLRRISCDSVLVDNQKAALKVATHFIGQGIRNFAYIGQEGKLDDDRLEGFRLGLLAAGLELKKEHILRLNYDDKPRCCAAMAELLRQRPNETLGLFCYHDLFATRVINICHEMGIVIPDQVAIAGFDNLPRGEEMYPPLTSVSYPVREMAQLAFESLYTRIKLKNLGNGVCRYLDSQLEIRGSSLLKK